MSSPELPYTVIIDGSHRDGHIGASAILMLGKRRLGEARLALYGRGTSTEAEYRALLLAVTAFPLPPGSRLVVTTDLLEMAQLWEQGQGGSCEELLRQARQLAEGAGLQVEVKKVDRNKVNPSHRASRDSRRKVEHSGGLAEDFNRLVVTVGLPRTYEGAIINLLLQLPGEPKGALEVLQKRKSTTAQSLYRVACKNWPLLARARQYVHELKQEGPVLEHQGMVERDEYWKGLPPTPRQLNYLAALGYKGETPKNLYEASVLIEKLRGENPSPARNNPR